jgi:peroxiredoxin
MRTEYVAVGACELPRNRLLVLAFYEKASAMVCGAELATFLCLTNHYCSGCVGETGDCGSG